ncbi:MAG: Ig-like domain-containing protein, partial [Bacteroidota bacterium]
MRFFYPIFLLLTVFLFGNSQLMAQAGNTITLTDDLGTGTLDFTEEINGRNAYESVDVPFGDVRIAWSGTRWEAVAVDQNNNLIYFSNYDVAPNPPDFATGNWQNASSTTLLALSGSGTQAVNLTFSPFIFGYCVNGDTETLGGGAPAGGVYSGPGVTDDGNGMTFTFDPAAAGVGTQTISYGDATNTTTASLNVLDLPVINAIEILECPGSIEGEFTVRIDGSLNSGAGWQWLNPSFDPTVPCSELNVFRTGDTITTSFSQVFNRDLQVRVLGGCNNGGDPICFTYNMAELSGLAQLDLDNTVYCVGDAAVTGLGGGRPSGGVYSGPGVTDDGNGMTFSFDPAMANTGTSNIIYTVDAGTICGETADTVAVSLVATPMVTFAAPGPFATNAGLQTLDSGTPAGGTYSGTGVIDNGDGTFSFDPATGVGTYTITYTVTNNDGCSASTTGDIVVEMGTSADDACDGATAIDALLGQAVDEPQTSMLFDNTGYTTEDDPSFAAECFFQEDPFQSTIWFTFTGDGNTYNLRTVECGATNYLSDTQAALYSGPCDALTFLDCSEDEDGPGGIFSINMDITTEVDVVYRLAIDGFEGAAGEFCVQVTNLGGIADEGNTCATAGDISGLFGQAENMPQTSGQYRTFNYNSDASDPTTGFECFEDQQPLSNTNWLTFTGDGNRYQIKTIACGVDDYADDLQAVVYTGACDNLTAVACNEDEDFDDDLYNILLELDTEAGVQYTLMLDRFDGNLENDGDYCVEVTNLGTSQVIDVAQTDIRIFPNPTESRVFFENVVLQRVDVLNSIGQVVTSRSAA